MKFNAQFTNFSLQYAQKSKNVQWSCKLKDLVYIVSLRFSLHLKAYKSALLICCRLCKLRNNKNSVKYKIVIIN